MNNRILSMTSAVAIMVLFTIPFFTAYGIRPWMRWNNIGDSWLDIDNEVHWGNSTSTQNTEWRCFTDNQLAGHYITSILFSVSGKTKYDNQGQIKNKFNEVLYGIQLTNHTFNESLSANGWDYLDHSCYDENGKLYDTSDWQTYSIETSTMSLVDRNSTEDNVLLYGLNIYIPKNVVLVFNYGTSCSQPCEELFSSHVRLGLK